MEQLKIQELYSDLSKTMAKELLESKIYPWEVLPEISAFLVKLGNAIGAYAGGLTVSEGYRYPALTGVPFALTGFILFLIFYKKYQARY